MRRIKKILQKLGPGFITGASDDDPSGIATYAQTGAQFGYHQLWTALFTAPFMIVIQEMCGRIGMVTGKGLAGVFRKYYSPPILYAAVFLLLIANIINIGADLGAMAAATKLVFNIPFILILVSITALTLFLEIYLSYRTYARVLKYLALSLFAYVVVVFMVKQNWTDIALSTFTPHIAFSKAYLLNIIAILGTTISPYLFFWQAGEQVEEEVAEHKLRMMGKGVPKITVRDIRGMRMDTIIGMVFSNLIMFFIIATTASTLHLHGITAIETAPQAAEALRPLAGEFTFFIFALGIVGTGLLAVPVLAGSASYALSEAFGLKEGLYRKFSQARTFYAIIAVATLIGLMVGFTPIKSFTLLYWAAILNGICAPFLMIGILLIANNRTIMGKHTNSLTTNVLGISITALMAIATLALLVNLF